MNTVTDMTPEMIAIELGIIKDPAAYTAFGRVGFTGKQLNAIAKAYAEYHVRQALETAANEAGIVDTDDYLGMDQYRKEIDRESILSAYPESLIR